MIGIYAGRFQPFHLGHLNSLNHILSKAEETFVLICSKSENHIDDRNPFTYEERKEMISKSLGIYRRVHFRHIKDQTDDREWARIIEKEIPKGRKVSFSNNPNTTKAFRLHGYESLPLPIKYEDINATLIRELIVTNKEYKHLIPQGTLTVIEDSRI